MSQTTVSEYILSRLAQQSVSSIFGVPGDFNLEFLDYIESSPHHSWVGNANELNASYAADGGVGELSALCGVAGMMSERLPLLHLVGIPSTKLQHKHALLHHTLGDGTFGCFAAMSRQIVCDMAILDDAATAGPKIDALLTSAITQHRPVYLGLPTDLVHAMIPAGPLDTPLKVAEMSASDESVQHVVTSICSRISAARDPIFLVDACASRFGVEGELLSLIECTGLQFFLTPMGKATLSENHRQYGGCYIGANSLPSVRKLVEASDLVITVGGILSDFNTGSFSYDIKTKNTIELHSDHVKLGFALFPNMSMKTLIPILEKRFKSLPPLNLSNASVLEEIKEEQDNAQEPTVNDQKWGKDVINQNYFWPTVGKFFKERDIILAETGTSSFGVLDIPFPEQSIAVSQVLWGSIGYTCPATLGCALAARELAAAGERERRTILFIGDGSLQLTLQEIGTMMRRGVKPFLFVLNNDGYEIERQIHGPNAEYNDIQPYNHSLIFDIFSKPNDLKKSPYKFHKVTTRTELEALLGNTEFAAGNEIQMIEVFLPRGDAPRALITQSKLTAEANAQ